MTAIHKELAYARVTHKGPVIHTVVHEDEYWRNLPGGYISLLPVYNLFNSRLVVFSVNKEVRDELTVVAVALFRSRHGYPRRQMLLVPEDVGNEAGFARSALAYEYTDLVVRHRPRVKLSQLNSHPGTCGHIFGHSAAH